MAILDQLSAIKKAAGDFSSRVGGAVLGGAFAPVTALKNVVSSVPKVASPLANAQKAASLGKPATPPLPSSTSTQIPPGSLTSDVFRTDPALRLSQSSPGSTTGAFVAKPPTQQVKPLPIAPTVASVPLQPARPPSGSSFTAPSAPSVQAPAYTPPTISSAVNTNTPSDVTPPPTKPVSTASTEPKTAQDQAQKEQLAALRQAYLGSFGQSSDEADALRRLRDIQAAQANVAASEALGTQKMSEQPIMLGLIRGQQQALQRQAAVQQGALAAQAQPLEAQIQALQAARALSREQAKTALGFTEADIKADRDARATKEGFTLGEGQQRFDAEGNLIASGAEKSTAQPATVQEYLFAKQNGFTGSFLEYQKAKDQATAAQTGVPNSYKEWQLAGQPGTYAEYLQKTTGKAPTEAQSRAATFAARLGTSLPIIDQLGSKFTSVFSKVSPLEAFKSEDRKLFEQAEADFINATLRRESGAAIAPSEFESARRQYIPQVGDTDAVLAQKKINRDIIKQGLEREAAAAAFVPVQNQSGGGDALDAALQQLGFRQDLGRSEKGLSGLGTLSAKFESGGSPAAIGHDSTGGWSYGTYQLAHDNAKTFVQQSPYASEFQGIPFNSDQFRNKWRAIASRDPVGFEKAQHDFIQRTHFEPQAKKLASVGVDVNQLPKVVQDAVWSTAVQHGPNTNIVADAIKKAGTRDMNKLVYQIYVDRWNNGKNFASSKPEVQLAVYNRFFGKDGELANALKQTNYA